MFSTHIKDFISIKNYPSFQPKAIFFDMDGVLFDSMKNHASAWVSALTEVGLPFSEYEAYMNEGRTGASTIDGVFEREYGRPATEEEKHHIYHLKSTFFEKCGQIEQMPYAIELLQKIKLQKLDIFLVTGSGQASLLESLNHSFPDIFHSDKVVTAFDVKFGKPNPEPYLMALKKSGYQPWEIMVVENAPLGVESANAAGLFTIAVNTGPLNSDVLRNSGANIVLDSIEELYQKWDKILETSNQL